MNFLLASTNLSVSRDCIVFLASQKKLNAFNVEQQQMLSL